MFVGGGELGKAVKFLFTYLGGGRGSEVNISDGERDYGKERGAIFINEGEGEYSTIGRSPQFALGNGIPSRKLPTNKGNYPPMIEGVVFIKNQVFWEVMVEGDRVFGPQPTFLEAKHIALLQEAGNTVKNSSPPSPSFRVGTEKGERPRVPTFDPRMGDFIGGDVR